MVAAGAYLWELRDIMDLSREDVAVHFNTSDSQIERIEKGRTDTRGTLLFQLLDYLGGSETDLKRLVLDSNATAEDGRNAARAWLQSLGPSDDGWLEGERTQVARILEHDDEVDVIAVIQQMREDLERLEERVVQKRSVLPDAES